MAKDTPGKSEFPMMGESLVKNLVNISGNRSPYTQLVAKKTMGRGASPTGKAAVRGRSAIKEANGPKCHIVASLYKQNVAEASATERNTKLLPKVVERPDRVGSAGTFWDKRKYASQGV